MSEYAVIEKSTDVVVQCTCAGSESDALLLHDPSVYYAKECKTADAMELGYNLDGKYAKLGWKYDSSSEKYYEWPCPRTNFVLNSNKKWQPPSDPPDGFASPNYYHMSEEVSVGYKWNDNIQAWESRQSDCALGTTHSG